jgi:ammonia channel protein AmtB
MRNLSKLDWLTLIAAVPVGAALGAAAGAVMCFMVFKLTGTGSSHNDAFNFFGIIYLGGFVGTLAGPVLVWRRWRRESAF